MAHPAIPLVLLHSLALAPACKRGAEAEPPDREPPGPRAGVEDRSGVAEVRHPSAPVTVTFPGSWTTELDGESLTALSADEMVLLMFFVVAAADLDASMEALDAELDEVIADSELSGFHEGEVGGMTAAFADGSGSMQGQRVSLGIALVLLPGSLVMIVLGVANPTAPASTAREFQQIMKSIRPASA